MRGRLQGFKPSHSPHSMKMVAAARTMPEEIDVPCERWMMDSVCGPLDDAARSAQEQYGLDLASVRNPARGFDGCGWLRWSKKSLPAPETSCASASNGGSHGSGRDR